ncbi:MAG: phosphotransferase [Planctomycetales bacterium]|nr:phosphotransferase [Planctomycetales bacterium]MBN8627115.1 phosphotransferase [Planctomycetota bacterium]
MTPEQLAAIAASFAGLPRPSGVPTRHFGSGLSGAEIWRLPTAGGDFALKAWPNEFTTADRPEWIAQQLRATRASGSLLLPVPLATSDDVRRSCVLAYGRLWQCEPWLPGRSELATKTDAAILEVAFAALAELHAALRSGAERECRRNVSPAIAKRREVWNEAAGGGWDEVRRAIERTPDEGEHRAADQWSLAWRKLSSSVDAMLELCERGEFALQVVHGDLHAEHVLFDAGRVSGFIDFSAAAVDSRALDIARLLGSTAGDDAEFRRIALSAYREAAKSSSGLSVEEDVLVDVFDRSATLLAPYRWFRWIYVENQTFANAKLVASRRRRLMDRLRKMAETS